MPYDSVITSQLKILKIIYYALFSGMLLFFIIVIVFTQSDKAEARKDLDKIFTVIVPIFGLLTMLISKMIYNKMITNYSVRADLSQKIMHYRNAKIISWAIVETACFLAFIATLLTSNYLYMAVVIFLFGYFFMLKPSRESLVRDMQLNSEESDIILKRKL